LREKFEKNKLNPSQIKADNVGFSKKDASDHLWAGHESVKVKFRPSN